LIYAVFEQSDDDFTMDEYSPGLYAVNTDQLLPSFYRKTLVAKIFEAQGYTFVTDLVAEDIYDKSIEFNADVPNRGNDMSHHECTVVSTQLDVANTLLFDGSTVTGISPYVNDATFQGLTQLTEKRFTLTDSCRVTVDFSLSVFYTQNTAYNNTLAISVIRTGAATTSSEIINIPIRVIGEPNDVYNFTMTFDVLESDLGDVYFQVMPVCAFDFGFFFDSGSSYTVRDIELISNSNVTTSFPNNYITGAVPVPDMKEGEYLKELAKMYQWIFDTDEITKTVTARRFDNIKENIPQALDFSDKIDANKIKTTFGIAGFGQTNALKYKEDDITKYDAVGYINVADTTLKPEKKYVEMSKFAASSARLRFDTINAPYVPMFSDNLPTNGLANRTLLARPTTFAHNINFARFGSTPANHPTNDVTFAYFAEAGNTDSLDFPTLIERFYQTVIDMNDKGKTVDCEVNLNIKDVMNYDPFIPIYISSMGNYFYWEKLSNYVKGKKTKCKFVKI
jgi:hypothetical protein